jgi:hypothetical protein
MVLSWNSAATSAKVVALTVIVGGCNVPLQPVPTIWQRLGIPQAAAGMRDGIANRSGNRPQLERKPRLLRIADEANLASENPAIKAAAEIKQQEDLAPQKIKALKYLATVGCGCYDKDGKIEEALLAALKDCTEEVRVEAANAIAEAAGTCACKYDGCTPTCCKPAVVKQLYDMAYGADKDGCPIEPSREVRAAAARAMSACSAVPQPEAEEKKEETPPVNKGGEAVGPPEVKGGDSPEVLPPPDAPSPIPVPLNASARTKSAPMGGMFQQDDYAIASSGFGVSPVLTTVTTDSKAASPVAQEGISLMSPEEFDQLQSLEAPEGMVIAVIERRAASDRVVIEMDQEYEINPGDALLISVPGGRSVATKVINVSGYSIEVGAADLENLNLGVNEPVFIGLVDE